MASYNDTQRNIIVFEASTALPYLIATDLHILKLSESE